MRSHINVPQLFRCSSLAAFFLVSSGEGFAVSITTFSFTGAAGNEASLAADSQPAGAVVSRMTRGSGVTGNLNAETFSSSSWTTSPSRDLNDYYSFSIAADAGYSLSLTRVELDERRSGTGIREWAIYSSLDSFASALASFSVPDDTSTRSGQGVNLGTDFSALTGSLEFRIYGFGAETSGGTWRIDNVDLEGEVKRSPSVTTVPDSGSSMALLGLALGSLGYVVRRRVT